METGRCPAVTTTPWIGDQSPRPARSTASSVSPIAKIQLDRNQAGFSNKVQHRDSQCILLPMVLDNGDSTMGIEWECGRDLSRWT